MSEPNVCKTSGLSRDDIIENNMKLVYYFYNRLRQDNFVKENKDDLISEGCIGLVRAVDGFDENRGFLFASYAARCIKSQMLMFIRRKKKWINEVSLFSAVTTDGEGNELLLIDVLEDKNNTAENIEYALTFDAFYNSLCQRDKNILDLRKMKYSQKEIADLLNLNQAFVSRVIARLKERYRKLVNNT